MKEPTKNKPGRKSLPYATKPLNVRLNVALIDRMNEDDVNKTDLMTQLLTNHFEAIDKKALHN